VNVTTTLVAFLSSLSLSKGMETRRLTLAFFFLLILSAAAPSLSTSGSGGGGGGGISFSDFSFFLLYNSPLPPSSLLFIKTHTHSLRGGGVRDFESAFKASV